MIVIIFPLLVLERVIEVTNHPVHIQNDKRNYSPSALIPFCEFGENLSIMGIKVEQFDVPVCNSFKAKIVRDQLCYEVNPNQYRRFLTEEDELSLTLYINYNEDRAFSLESNNAEYQHQNKFIKVGSIGNV